MFVSVKKLFYDRWQKWIQQRSPKATRVELNQRRVFIFPTKYGFLFLLTAFLLFMGGVNYENSLILNLSFFLVSLFLVAILQTFRNLSGLILVAEGAKSAFDGESALFTIGLEQSSNREYESLQVSWGEQKSERVNVLGNIQQTIDMSLIASGRGWFCPGRFKIQSTFPLGLLRTWSWVHLDVSALVYPSPLRCDYVEDDGEGEKEGKRKIQSGQDEFEHLKQYQVGDSLKKIAWKKYANNQTLLSKVFYGVAGDTCWLNWNGVPASGTEAKLSMLCYWVIKYSEQERVFGLSLPSGDIEPGAGRDHELTCLRALALYGYVDI